MTGFGLSLPKVLTRNISLIDATVIALVLWLFAVLLLAMNRSIYMLKEGYGKWNPARLIAPIEQRRYKKLLGDVSKLGKQFKQSTDEAEKNELRRQRAKLLRKAVEQFPDADHLLPTRFGNILRAFEAYPRLIYGFEGVEGWNRLLAMVPKEYRELVDDAKAQTDFWLNLWFINLLLLLECISLAVYVAISGPAGDVFPSPMLWCIPAFLVAALVASRGARVAAVEWGDLVKASYDTFLPELAMRLGFSSSTTLNQERELWILLSRVIVYRDHRDMIELVKRLSRESHDGTADRNSTGTVREPIQQPMLNESEDYELIRKALAREFQRADRLEEELRNERNKDLWQRLFGDKS
jgi:hypothetical protein